MLIRTVLVLTIIHYQNHSPPYSAYNRFIQGCSVHLAVLGLKAPLAQGSEVLRLRVLGLMIYPGPQWFSLQAQVTLLEVHAVSLTFQSYRDANKTLNKKRSVGMYLTPVSLTKPAK